VELDETARERLIRTAVSLKEQVRAVLRARIVPAPADGLSNGAIARELAVHVNTVPKRRGRFTAQGPDGLKDASRSGRPKTCGAQVALTMAATVALFASFDSPCSAFREALQPRHFRRSPQAAATPAAPVGADARHQAGRNPLSCHRRGRMPP
jgi:hypothetical protein